MFTDLVLPNVGFGMEEGRLIAWLKQPGDAIRKGEAVAEVEGDKTTVELEATVDGILDEILVPADQVAAVGTVLARIRTTGAAPAIESTSRVDTPAGRAGENPRATPVAQRLAQERGIDLSRVPGSGPGGRITREDVEALAARPPAPRANGGRALAAPAVRRLAREHGIDLTALAGSGEGGRVTRADVEAAIAHRTPVAAMAAAAEAPLPRSGDSDRIEVPLSPIRQTIARRVQASAQEAPHFYTTAQLDLTDPLRALPAGVGVNALLLHATVQALLAVPALNATFEAGRLYRYDHVHLAIAVALDDGLMMPVLRRADDYSLSGLAERAADLIGRARAGRLRADELSGGTFSVSNLGMVEQVERFTAILNPPQVGILAVGAAKERPVVLNGGLHIRTTAYVTLSVDHRVIDGLVAARFLEALDRQLRAYAR